MTPAIEAVAVDRAFGGVRALSGASFSAESGEVHALVGENGAGKSTMIRILSGAIQAEAGEVRVGGQALGPGGVALARSLGVGTVFQEAALLPWMTVAENLLLNDLPRNRLGLVRRRSVVPAADEVLARFGVDDLDPRELAANLSVGQRQVLEIVRALHGDPAVLILDEPTAALSRRETDWLFDLVREVRARGVATVFTSHRWREVEELADRITVFRDGTHVATRTQLTEAEAVTLMTGRTIERMYPPRPPDPHPTPALQVADLHGAGLQGVSFTLHRGEIAGLGGLSGQGQRQLMMTLFGVSRPRGGVIRVGGDRVRLRRPSDAIRHGLALVPEDRRSEGLLLSMPVRDNLSLATLPRYARFGLVRRRAETAAVETMVSTLRIGGPDDPADRPAGTLSGGNQQKVLLGRWLLTGADVFLLHDVTRGVDASTKHDLYELITGLAAEGKAVLLYSSDTEELAHLCHRVLVMREGQVVTELTGPVGAETIVAAALGEPARA